MPTLSNADLILFALGCVILHVPQPRAPRSVRLHITRMLVRTRQSHQRRYARYIPCTVFCGVRWRKDHFPLFSESIPPQHGYSDGMDASRDGQHNMPMPGTALLHLQTPNSAPTALLNLTRPPPENIPLDVIRLNRAGDSQRNANGLIPGRGTCSNIKRRMRRREDLDHPVISPRLER